MNKVSLKTDILEYAISPFSLKEGEALLMFLHHPEDIFFCKNQEKYLDISERPYWVKHTTDKINRKSLKIISEHIDYLAPFLTESFSQHKTFKKRDFYSISGSDIRIINMFLRRVQNGINFFELNLSGLTGSSIKTVLEFVLQEIKSSDYKASYLLIESLGQKENFIQPNPIYINTTNINQIHEKYFWGNREDLKFVKQSGEDYNPSLKERVYNKYKDFIALGKFHHMLTFYNNKF
jgi:hypothetical protein